MRAGQFIFIRGKSFMSMSVETAVSILSEGESRELRRLLEIEKKDGL